MLSFHVLPEWNFDQHISFNISYTSPLHVFPQIIVCWHNETNCVRHRPPHNMRLTCPLLYNALWHASFEQPLNTTRYNVQYNIYKIQYLELYIQKIKYIQLYNIYNIRYNFKMLSRIAVQNQIWDLKTRFLLTSFFASFEQPLNRARYNMNTYLSELSWQLKPK